MEGLAASVEEHVRGVDGESVHHGDTEVHESERFTQHSFVNQCLSFQSSFRAGSRAYNSSSRVIRNSFENPLHDVLARVPGDARGAAAVLDDGQHRAGQRGAVVHRDQPADVGRGDELAVAAGVGRDDRFLHRHRLADRPGDAGAGPRGVDDEVARGEDVRHVGAVFDRR